MASVGRGRGRGWANASTQQEPVLRRPGAVVGPPKPDYGTFYTKISQLESGQNCQDQIYELRQITMDMLQTVALKAIMENLYQYAINNREMQEKIMLLFLYPGFRNISESEKCAFGLFFVPMQEDFQRRNELRQEDTEHFRNVVYLLCITYYHLRSHFSVPHVLQEPVIDYMEMLLETAALEDIEIVAEQLAMSGKRLQAECQEKVDQLMCAVRETVITKHLCSTSRALLLYTIDLANHGFNTIPSNLQKFYASQLANTNLMRKQKNTKGLSPEGENEETGNDKTMIQKNQSVTKNNAVPRAIRGSGATQQAVFPAPYSTIDHSSTSGKSHSMNSMLPKNNSSRKMWENEDESGKSCEGYYYSEQ